MNLHPTANIVLGDRPQINGCLIIRLDDSAEVLRLENEGAALGTNIILTSVPTLRGWLKLWWKLRKRPSQPPVQTVVRFAPVLH